MKKFYKKLKWTIFYLLFIYKFKNDFKSLKNRKDKNIGILITAWYETTVPFFSCILTITLNKLINKNVIVIHDDIYFSVEKYNPKYQYYLINKLISFIPSISVVKLSELDNSEDINEDEVNRIAYANLVHDTRQEVEIDAAFESTYKNQVNLHFKKIRTLLNNFNFEYLIVPGGISLSSGIFHSECKKFDTRLITFDSGIDILQFCTNGVASHLEDLPSSLQSVYEYYTIETCKQLENAGRKLLQDRIKGVDRFAYQRNNKNISNNFDYILLVLNVPWDSAALLQLKYFKNQYEWIIETLKFVISKTNKKIVIREHPADCLNNKSNIDYKKLINVFFGNNERIIFIKSEDKINTYGLIEQANLVVVNTSSVGLECALLGKNVISVSNPYYCKAKFVHSPNTQSEYFENLLKSNLSMQDFDINRAFALYYLAQEVSFGSSPIYPGNSFLKWIFKDKKNIYFDNDIMSLISSIDKNIPYSYLYAKKFI